MAKADSVAPGRYALILINLKVIGSFLQAMFSDKYFNRKIDFNDENGCWLWQGFTDKDGYGALAKRRNGERLNTKAHRYAWMLTHGEIPEGLYICHHCDVRNCVNPEHLFLGTQKDNMQDAKNKGRRVGSAVNAKLTDSDVLKIRADSRKHSEIAADYNIYETDVSRIKRRERYVCVEGPSSVMTKHNQRLTDEQILSIREDGRKHKEIARDYGISWKYVGMLKHHQRRRKVN